MKYIITLTTLIAAIAVLTINADMGNWKDLYTESGKDAFVERMKKLVCNNNCSVFQIIVEICHYKYITICFNGIAV